MPETSVTKLLDLGHVKIDPVWAMRLPANLAIRRQVLPISAVNGSLVVACADPNDAAALEAVQRFTGRTVIARAADPDSLKRAISRVYSGSARASRGAGRIGSLDLQSSSIDLEKIDSSSFTADLLHAAVLRQASDIHIDPGRESMRIRLRVDGVLEEFGSLSMKAFASVMSRFK